MDSRIDFKNEEQHWLGLIEGWKKSGLLVKEYAIQKGIQPQRFYNWRSRLRKRGLLEEGSISKKVHFESLEIEEDSLVEKKDYDCRLSFPNGFSFEWSKGFSISDLPKVLQSLSSH